jgi:hypothetical protein
VLPGLAPLEHNLPEVWENPTECPSCDAPLTAFPEKFQYECPAGHVWTKEQFFYGNLEEPYSTRSPSEGVGNTP